APVPHEAGRAAGDRLPAGPARGHRRGAVVHARPGLPRRHPLEPRAAHAAGAPDAAAPLTLPRGQTGRGAAMWGVHPSRRPRMEVTLEGSSPAATTAGIMLLTRARQLGYRLAVSVVGNPDEVVPVTGPALLYAPVLASCGVGREDGSGATVVVPG